MLLHNPNAGTALCFPLVRCLTLSAKLGFDSKTLPHCGLPCSWLSQSSPALHGERTRRELQTLWKPHAESGLTALLGSAATQSNAGQLGGSAQPGDVLSDGVVSAIETEEQEVSPHPLQTLRLSPHSTPWPRLCCWCLDMICFSSSVQCILPAAEGLPCMCCCGLCLHRLGCACTALHCRDSAHPAPALCRATSRLRLSPHNTPSPSLAARLRGCWLRPTWLTAPQLWQS